MSNYPGNPYQIDETSNETFSENSNNGSYQNNGNYQQPGNVGGPTNGYNNPYYFYKGNSYYGNNGPDNSHYTNNNYPDYYTQYPGYPTVYPMQRPRHRSGFRVFLVLFAIVMGAAYFSVNFVEGRLGGQPISPGLGSGSDATDQGKMGFRVLPNDPLINQQYALSKINVSDAWKITQGSADIVVAVIDTGVDPNHPDLKGKLVKGYDFVEGDPNSNDMVGHGTFVASLIAARSNDEIGISGVAPNVKIMPLKVMNSESDSSSLRISRAIRYAADNGAKVINLSLGGPAASRSIKTAIDYALSKNVVVVAASGNEGNLDNAPNYPASFSGVISVGATGSRDTVASFSNYNKAVAVTAPGVNIIGARSQYNQICQPYRSQDYCVASGTSFAAPYVAGTAALVLSVNPKLTSAQVTSILEKSAKDLGPTGKDDYYGYGRIDAGKAVELAKTL